ncbi:hypothetical protein Mp_8g02660 [Marchantia polymorpha subsp. ruderalis]|uniref:Uncharacterized protein n=1 Tax=Marchantia polymorpha TaxID=3197 RepID=A0A2R6XJ44_MARPO|nr:hypothetical protein MARPO_0012s0059 [Marchantia polymorpha]BBN18459.1 hypothetical protein Mp_8g02660 [Marchantia polymorpha subsp. ruderalis]|eukprot:PTQ46102.1 hypothetical protein MARPO_0012s0059 [Marchantia polymorpha]
MSTACIRIIVANGSPLLPFPFATSNGDSCTHCAKPSDETSSGVGKLRISNGLVWTLASLKEILNAQETSAQKSRVRVGLEVAVGAEFSFLDTRVFVIDRLHTVSWSYLFAIHMCKGNVAAEEKGILELVSLNDKHIGVRHLITETGSSARSYGGWTFDVLVP